MSVQTSELPVKHELTCVSEYEVNYAIGTTTSISIGAGAGNGDANRLRSTLTA